VAIYVDYNVSAGICCFIHSRVHQKHIRECLHVVHRANGKKQSVLIGARGTKEARDILPAGRALYSWLHQPCIPAMSFALIYTWNNSLHWFLSIQRECRYMHARNCSVR